MAILGVYWSLKPPPARRPSLPIFVLVALAALGCFVVVIQQQRSEASQEAAAQTHRDVVERFRADLAQARAEAARAEALRQADSAYLRAKLEDAYEANKRLERYAPAILSSLAKTGAPQPKPVPNPELRRRTIEVMARMGRTEEIFITKRFAQVVQAQQSKESPASEEEKRRVQAALNEAATKAVFERDRAFKGFRAEAVFVRNELLNRTGTPAPLEGQIADVFDRGVLSGSSPLSNAGRYLQSLLEKVPP